MSGEAARVGLRLARESSRGVDIGATEPSPHEEGQLMKYGLAWLLGVPPVLIAGWFLLNHC